MSGAALAGATGETFEEPFEARHAFAKVSHVRAQLGHVAANLRAELGDISADFGAQAGLPLVAEGGDAASGGRVVSAQIAVFPAKVQVEDRAVSLVGPAVKLFYWDGLVDAIHQPVASQGRTVEPPQSRRSANIPGCPGQRSLPA